MYGENGDIRPPADEDEQYLDLARRLVQAFAGGWSPDSIPGRNATAEFEAFVRETQARALEQFLETLGVEDEESPYWQAALRRQAEDIRAERLDLSGNKVAP